MARRDNQGIQIAMIVFILTTLLFMVTTYFGYSRSTTLSAELDKAKSDLSNASSQRDSADRLATNLKTKIGIDAGSDDATTESLITEMVEVKYGQGLPPESQTLEGIILDRGKRVTELAQQLAAANKQIQQLRQDLSSAREVAAQQLAEANALRQKAQEDYNLVNQEKTDYIADNDAKNRAYVEERNKMQVELDKAVADATKQVAQFEQERDAAIRRASLKQDELNVILKDTPDQYDGSVLGVVAAQKEVLLDVGRADGVRPKTTFGIYDAEESNVRTAKKKASVEVTRVLADHRCLARITDSAYVSPIIPGDYIYSPIWSPGTRLGVALVGEMDIDQDGLDDRKYIVNLIEINGGRVDAQDVDGKLVGNMTVNTRYIVVGEGELSGKVAGDMLKTAKDLTIERMSVTELLDLMSPPGRARSLTYGGASRPGDFAPQPQDGATRSSVGSSTSFRQRTPTPRRRRTTKVY